MSAPGRVLAATALLTAGLLLAPSPARAARTPTDVISSVELHLPRGVDVATVKQLVAVRAGQRLHRRALRHAVRLLYETRLFEQVRVHVRRSGAGLAVTFVLTPRRRIADVTFVGATPFDAATLLRTSGLKREESYVPEAVERARKALVEAHARRGWRDAEVRPEIRESETGLVAVVFRIDQGPRTLLAGVRFEGRPRLPLDVLSSALGLSIGGPLDLDAVDTALERLRARLRAAGYLQANLGKPRVEPVPERAGHWGRLVLPVEAGPLIRITVAGATVLTPEEVLAALELPDDEPLTEGLLEDGVARVERRYRLLGRWQTRMSLLQREVRGRYREVRIVVHEAPALRVTDIRFPGRSAFPADNLKGRICQAVGDAMPPAPMILDPAVLESFGGHRPGPPPQGREPPPDPCTVYDPDSWRAALEDIADLYRSQGWLSVKVSEPELLPGPKEHDVVARIAIDEGVQTRVDAVVFEGTPGVDPALLHRTVKVKAGDPLSYLSLEEARYALRGLFAHRGHPFAAVHDSLAFDASRARARVIYRIDAGPEVRVGRIIVRGHHHTPAALVRSRLTFHQGEVWDVDRARDSQQAILGLGIYRSAAVRFLDPEDPAPVMDVLVSVSERKPRAVELGFGISTEDGPRAFVDYTNLAFWGNSELNARAKLNYPVFPYRTTEAVLLTPGMEWETHLGLRFPSLADVRTALVWERDNRPVYGLTRLAGSVGSAARLTDAVSASLKLELDFEDLTKGKVAGVTGIILTQRDRDRLRLDEGQWLLASLRPAVTVDLRDDPFRPRRGWLLTGALDWSKDLGIRASPVHFVKATAAVSRYQPGPAHVTFALSAQGGVVVPLSADNHTIGPKRFFLGGADNLRGFAIDSVVPEDQRAELHDQAAFCSSVLDKSLCSDDAREVVVEGLKPTSAGGEAYLLFKGEVRFPLLGDLQGGVFVDMGNLWRDPAAFDPLALRTTAGAGLRYETPVGPVALDLGFNLAPDGLLREDPYAIHFAIGLF